MAVPVPGAGEGVPLSPLLHAVPGSPRLSEHVTRPPLSPVTTTSALTPHRATEPPGQRVLVCLAWDCPLSPARSRGAKGLARLRGR